MKSLSINERFNLTFGLRMDFKGQLDDRIHNVLIMRHTYRINEDENTITINNVTISECDYLISLVNGLED